MTDVLLAAFNSEPFLARQIESILAQRGCGDFRLVIRDGGSSDGTEDVIRQFLERNPDRITYEGSVRADACANFAALLEASRADYIFFSDHDDVWQPDKMRLELRMMKELEEHHGTETPLMVFSDAYVADPEERILAQSALRQMHLDPHRLKFTQLILQNVPSGNTMLINKALRDKALPLPPQAVMHDHWLALTAAAFGEIGFLNLPTVLYRQHGDNYYGAFRYSPAGFLKKAKDGRVRILERLHANLDQAAAFLERHAGETDREEGPLLRDLQGFRDRGFWERRRIIFRHGLWKSGFFRNLGMLLIL